MEHFTYLDSLISNDDTVSKDLDSRLSKASSSCVRLQKRVWQSHSLRLSTKIQVYRAVDVPTLYGTETWILFRKQIRLLERFHQRCLRSILGIIWQDHVSNGWAGHVTMLEDVGMPKVVQRAPRRKARSWCSKKALQRSAEETAGTGGNQPSVMATGGLRPRQLALISEKSPL